MPHARELTALLLAAGLASATASAAGPSVTVEVHHAEGLTGSVTVEVAGALPCVVALRSDGRYHDACTLPLPAAATQIRLSGEVRWKDGDGRKRSSKGTQAWTVLDVAPMAAPLRDASRPYAARVQALLAALPAFERASGDLVEEAEDRIAAGEKSPAKAVTDAEKRLGYALPREEASLVTALGAPTLGDSLFERPENLANAYDQMRTQWGTPPAALERSLTPASKALYRSGTILFTEAGDGYGGLLYRPAPVAECGGKEAYSWFHQDDINNPRTLRRADGTCRDFAGAMLLVLGELLFQQYDDTGDRGVVVDRSSPQPFRLRLHHDGGTPGPGFRLSPDWPRYE